MSDFHIPQRAPGSTPEPTTPREAELLLALQQVTKSALVGLYQARLCIRELLPNNADGKLTLELVQQAIDGVEGALGGDTRPAANAVGVPNGFMLVPVKLTPGMIEAAMAAHYGKRRVAAVGGAGGIDMTVNDVNYTGTQAMRNFWRGALSAAPRAPAADAAGLRREARNKVCIDGHLNAALDDIMRSNSPDGMFNLLGALAGKAIDIALDLSEQHRAPATSAAALSNVQALHAAVAAIYFDDNSDFRSALGAVVRHLDPALAGELLGSPKAAYDEACARLDTARAAAKGAA